MQQNLSTAMRSILGGGECRVERMGNYFPACAWPTHWDFALGFYVHVFLHTWLYVIFYGHRLLITVAPCHWRERDPVLP
jgi:hypothetical protein